MRQFGYTEAQYRSTARMRKLQPRIEQLKERFGDDRQRMSQAMMEMYKTEKVNPLGGCLPILVQIPIFIALYWVLLESVELRQAPFILWIDNLTAKDPYFVLPVLNAAFMMLTQRLTRAALRPSGKARCGYGQETIENQVVHQLELHRHARGHFPACAAGHDAHGLLVGLISQVLHHALTRPGNGVSATAGQGVAGVGGKRGHLARGHMQSGSARLEGTQHDAVARQNQAA
mgnify:CR=1 FL=1